MNDRWRLAVRIVLAGLLLVCAACRAGSASIREYRDIEYARIGDVSLKLDLYVPDASRQDPSPPLVVWIHGGGWRIGGKGKVPIRDFVNDGLAVASIQYRLSHQACFPAQIHDAKAAIRWLRAHADLYGFDGRRIGVAGESAGGHLAALLGLTPGHPELEGDVGEFAGQSSAVQAVCDVSGPADLMGFSGYDRATGPLSLIRALLGGSLRDREELARLASPVCHAGSEAPPFLIIHATGDPLVPYIQSRQLHRRLVAAGAHCDLVTLRGLGHGSWLLGNRQLRGRISHFFAHHLGSATGAGAL